MKNGTLFGANLLLLGHGFTIPMAVAQTAKAKEPNQAILLNTESQDFSKSRGSLRSVRLEYKFEDGDTTVLAGPSVGERTVIGQSDTSLGFEGAVYQDWSKNISTRTHLFVAENNPVYAHINASQDITARVTRRMTMTAGVRWAEYFGGRDVTFLSIGGRRYFTRGSIAYRLTWTKAEGRDAFIAHLANLTLNDSHGKGKTQLWLSTGTASLARSQFDNNFARSDRAFLIQRTQPLSLNFSIVPSFGLSSYGSAGGRYTGTNLGMGLLVALN